MMRSCARRSFDAATIFMAFVICCVFLTARTRRRRSISDGIFLGGGCLSRRKVAGKLLDDLVQRGLERIVKLSLLRGLLENLRMPRFDEREELGFEGAQVRDG